MGQQAGRWQRGAAAQQIPTVPEQAPVGWPLGARAQQPYASAAATVGQVVQAFRGHAGARFPASSHLCMLAMPNRAPVLWRHSPTLRKPRFCSHAPQECWHAGRGRAGAAALAQPSCRQLISHLCGAGVAGRRSSAGRLPGQRVPAPAAGAAAGRPAAAPELPAGGADARAARAAAHGLADAGLSGEAGHHRVHTCPRSLDG